MECEKQQCPSLQGCFLIVSGQKEGCCEVCKGMRCFLLHYKIQVNEHVFYEFSLFI